MSVQGEERESEESEEREREREREREKERERVDGTCRVGRHDVQNERETERNKILPYPTQPYLVVLILA